jgi:uncharacterized protein (TIGR03066 family)
MRELSPSQRRFAMRASTLTAVCGVLLVSGLNAAPIPKQKEKTTEEKLAGKWKLVKTDTELPTEFEFVIDYKPKGVLEFIRTPKEGKPVVSEGKYKVVDGDKIDWTINEFGNERGEVSKIKVLNDTKLVIEDPDGIKEEFEKITEKKPEKKDPEKKEPEKKDEK